MNRKQFIVFAGKLRKRATESDADARRVFVAGDPEVADMLREEAERFRTIAALIESKYG